MTAALPIIQIGISLLLVVLILLQNNEAGMGSAFGGEDGGPTRTRRGPEKIVFIATIVVAVIYVITSVVALLS